jgi:O-antigen ligase
MSLIISAIILFLAPLLSALPEEPFWSLLFGTFILIGCIVQVLRTKEDVRLGPASICILGVSGLAILSLLFHWLIIHRAAPTYLDVMLRGTVFWIAVTASFVVAMADRTRIAAYTRLLAITVGNSIAAGIGLQDYLFHLRGHQPQWREFGTSTPDFFAGQLIMTFPIAFSLFLGAKSGKEKIFWLPYLLAVLLQLAVIPTTGSRFALISLTVGIAVTLALLTLTVRRGMSLPIDTRTRLIALGIVAILGVLVVAKPILFRLKSSTLKTQAHSGDFRTWTWKGTVRLIEADPALGAGPGTFVYAYPKRAYVGFTRHAHNAYLQTAADLGTPALLLMLAGFGLIYLKGIDALKVVTAATQDLPIDKKRKSRTSKEPSRSESDILDQITLVDDKFLMMGLLGGLAAALVQNLIDSDWFTFASGITLFTMLGLVAGLSPLQDRFLSERRIKLPLVAVTAAAAVLTSFLFFAEFEEQTGNYLAATHANPLNATYQFAVTKHIYEPVGDENSVEKTLIAACRLAPDSVGYRRLGDFYMATRRPNAALKCYHLSLLYDPHYVPVLVQIAQILHDSGDVDAALGYYQRVADLETGPDGSVRAIPEVSETGFADADAAIGEYLLADRRPQQSVIYLKRATDGCEAYFDLNGYKMRQQMMQGRPDSELDSHMTALYVRVAADLSQAYQDLGKTNEANTVKAATTSKLQQFSKVISKGSQ